jgi:serine/threonine protein phosphatase PrpC
MNDDRIIIKKGSSDNSDNMTACVISDGLSGGALSKKLSAFEGGVLEMFEDCEECFALAVPLEDKGLGAACE